jgi:alpha-L-fucosidase 2
MLLQSPDPDTLLLLPALPTKWHTGHVKGLAAPGGRRVSIFWEDGKLRDFTVTGDTAHLTIKYNGAIVAPRKDA